MRIVSTAAELAAETARFSRVAFVPTMGNLHEGHLALMRPSLVRAELSSLGLLDVLIAPLNGPRHYLLTYLFDQRVARPLRDKIARHQHEGYEWFSLLNGTNAYEADEILCSVIEKMLNDLGIRPMQFKPGWHHD